MNETVAIFWFRRDLRLHDNHGLFLALQSGYPVIPLFIFDTIILNELKNNQDARVQFIHQTLNQLQTDLDLHHSSLLIRHGDPTAVWEQLIQEFKIAQVYVNDDYEPYAIQRDQTVNKLLQYHGISFHTGCDQVIFAQDDIVKGDGRPYHVFTAYKNAWRKKFTEIAKLSFYQSETLLHHLWRTEHLPFPPLQQFGFRKMKLIFPPPSVNEQIVKDYHLHRDYPAIQGTTRIGLYLRFGLISIRKLVALALAINEIWLNELIWREFFFMILYHYPRVQHSSFRPQYDRIQWKNDAADFECWCRGQTGFPLVDAGMRELNTTGFMHNRVRMITASFLTKDLLIDWRWGERYFAEKLLDYDLAANNGNWQWTAGTGCDAAPYFRVFNPSEQLARFDPQQLYIKQWVPEFGSDAYPRPMIDHAFARRRAIEVYANAVRK